MEGQSAIKGKGRDVLIAGGILWALSISLQQSC